MANDDEVPPEVEREFLDALEKEATEWEATTLAAFRAKEPPANPLTTAIDRQI